MQTTHYDFTGKFVKINGKRATKWDLANEIDHVYKSKRWYGYYTGAFYDHLSYAELADELKRALKS